MTTDLAIQVTRIRLVQTEELVAWLIQRSHSGGRELGAALDLIKAARVIMSRLPADSAAGR
jgi:hypothetical protein